MILGTYSIPHIYSIYKNNQNHSTESTNYFWLMTITVILWLTAFGLLLYYWYNLSLWARTFALIGLFFNVGGSIFTILVIFLGLNENPSSSFEKSSIDDSPFAMSFGKDNSSAIQNTELPSVSTNSRSRSSSSSTFVSNDSLFNEDIPL